MARKKTAPVDVDNQQAIDETAVEQTTTTTEEKPETEKNKVVYGVVANCSKLNVRAKPVPGSKVVHVINRGDRVTIDEKESTKDFYAVTVDSRVSGYCAKDYVTLEQ